MVMTLDEIRDARAEAKRATKWLEHDRPDRVYTKTGIPPRFWDRRLDDLDQDTNNESALRRAEQLLTQFEEDKWDEGIGLTFIGPPGTGKTTIACAVAATIAEQGFLVRYTTMGDVVAMLHRQFALDGRRDEAAQAEWAINDYKLEIMKFAAHLLVLDDVGKEKPSEYTRSVFDVLFRHRYDYGMPTVITSNVPVEEWGAAYSDAMEDFLYEATKVVVMSTGSRRRR